MQKYSPVIAQVLRRRVEAIDQEITDRQEDTERRQRVNQDALDNLTAEREIITRELGILPDIDIEPTTPTTAQPAEQPQKKKRVMSAATRAKIRRSAKARWRAIKKDKKHAA